VGSLGLLRSGDPARFLQNPYKPEQRNLLLPIQHLGTIAAVRALPAALGAVGSWSQYLGDTPEISNLATLRSHSTLGQAPAPPCPLARLPSAEAGGK